MKYVTKTPTMYPPCDVNSLSYVTGRRGSTVGSELALQSDELLKPSPTTFIFSQRKESKNEREELNKHSWKCKCRFSPGDGELGLPVLFLTSSSAGSTSLGCPQKLGAIECLQ